MSDGLPEWFSRMTPEQRRAFAELMNGQSARISPTQATALGFPTRDPATGLLVADHRLFRFESDGTL